jgi:hypothetical protein
MSVVLLGTVVALLAVAVILLAVRYIAARDRLRDLEAQLQRYRVDAESPVARTAAVETEVAPTESSTTKSAAVEAEVRRMEALAAIRERELAELEAALAALKSQLESVEEAVEIQSFGFYRPHYGFESSDEYAARLGQVREQQKQLIKSGQAAHCPTNWTVDGSAHRGKKMLEEQVMLMLRAFNGECDAAVSKVKYNNIVKLEQRIGKSFEAINKLGKSKQVAITVDYLELKLAELRLVHEHSEKVQEEKERQREIKEQMREEERARKEIEKVQAEAEKEETNYQKALVQARKELAEATGQQHDKLEQLVAKLEAELSNAIDRKAKAVARAQLTRSGHVYVISNIGSFGEDVYKIGMTRRLEPLLRVTELGDASVPFPFDVHAMIYSEDAPTLESLLHKEFDSRRVNKINTRKEYFRVSLSEIRQAVAKHFGVITFVTVPDAAEYRKSVAFEVENVSVVSRAS